jgi:alpha-tubulin suppressor-like RCC1 family protein
MPHVRRALIITTCWLLSCSRTALEVPDNGPPPGAGPSPVAPGRALRIAAGDRHTCALTTSGVWCWGYNGFGQLGDGSLTDRAVPVASVGLASGATAISAGDSDTTCALTNGGVAVRWGDDQLGFTSVDTYAATPTPVLGLSQDLSAVSVGSSQTCVLAPQGVVNCWGWNNADALGNGGPQTYSAVPAAIAGLPTDIVAVSTGGFQACVLTAQGGVECWGYNGDSNLGERSNRASATPVAVVGLGSGVVAISSGWDHTCAVTTAGGVVCWGSDERGQLGNGFSDRGSPAAVVGLSSRVTAVSAGWESTCAVTASGSVLCWGANSAGQLGDGSTNDRGAPNPVVGLSSGISDVAMGSLHACAVTAQGGVMCWGENDHGQLGDGTTTRRLTPVAVRGF